MYNNLAIYEYGRESPDSHRGLVLEVLRVRNRFWVDKQAHCGVGLRVSNLSSWNKRLTGFECPACCFFASG